MSPLLQNHQLDSGKNLHRSRGITLVTVLLVMTTLALLGLATQQLIERNIQLQGAHQQTQTARTISGSVIGNVFGSVGRPILAGLIQNQVLGSGFAQTDLTVDQATTPDLYMQIVETSNQIVGAIDSNAFLVDVTNGSTVVGMRYQGRSRVPPGSEAAALFPATINDGQFCADLLRIVAATTSTSGSRGAVDENIYIVSPCN